MTGPHVERLLWHMPTVAERASDEWVKGFAASILRQSRRRDWRPSVKQLRQMNLLVAEFFVPSEHEGKEESALIE